MVLPQVKGNGPLGLRTGTVRAVLALLVIATFCALSAVGYTRHSSVPAELTAMSGLVFGYYFGKRENDNLGNGNGTLQNNLQPTPPS
jgi:hypothetical protein